ncbi:hypothetical protein BDY21DRAFT_273347, partial [Lineolata rhizophorae]
EIETWVTALAHYDNNEFDEALKAFENIADTSKILFNMGVIHATLGEHEKAVDCYQRAVKLDQYLAIAYFQQGVSNFLMGDFEEALANFNDTLLYLRGNNNIDYEQLGLKFKLYSCEVLFNRGLCYIYLQQKDAGMQDLAYAAKEKVVPDHDVIDEAIKESAEGYTVFSIPVGIVYRPNDAKVKNLKTKDYLGKARLVAATDRSNAFTGFAGAEIKRMNEGFSASAKDDRPEEKISYAATNLVKPGLASRARQQSEPPLQRNMFPPTPPPENETRPSDRGSGGGSGSSGGGGGGGGGNNLPSRAQSVRNGGGAGMTPKPRALDLGPAAFDQSGMEPRPRIGTVRSASERPRPTREYSVRGGNRDTYGSRGMGRRAGDSDEDDPRGYGPDDSVYDLYQRRGSAQQQRRSKSTRRTQRPMYIEEEEEDELDDDDDYDQSSFDDAEFEMVSRAKSKRRVSPARAASRRRPGAGAGGGGSSVGSAGGGGVAAVRTIRVKVHAEDTRYVLVEPGVGLADFVDQVRTKFAMRQNFKIKMKDEGDMITMADQDDLDMAVRASRVAAAKEKNEMGKMEV